MQVVARTLGACLALALCPLAHADQYVKVGSWNIEHLGKREFGQHPKALAEHVQLSGVDVLALQEIYDTDGDPAKRTNGKLDDVVKLLNQLPGHHWDYLLFPKRKADETHQLCGVAWNKARVAMVGEAFAVPVVLDGQSDAWRRFPRAVKFSAGAGKTDFVVICVHMKSNRVETPPGVAPTPAQEQANVDLRTFEAKALVAQLDKVRQQFKDQDLIVLGDTNSKGAGEEALKALGQAGFRDLNARDLPTYLHGQSPFDRIFVPAAQPEFKFCRQYTLIASDREAHRKTLSDHFLVLTTIKVMEDDDPNE